MEDGDSPLQKINKPKKERTKKMPNWCENILTIEDYSPELAAYLKAEGLSFEKIKPTPPEMLEGDGWYGWRVDNWGTKWDLTDDEQAEFQRRICQDGSSLCVAFDTAWSPPTQAIVALSEMFPNDLFRLDYYECGCDMAGTDYIKDGTLNENILQNEEEIRLFAAEVFGYDNEEIMEEEGTES